jgi:hypothetical protein
MKKSIRHFFSVKTVILCVSLMSFYEKVYILFDSIAQHALIKYFEESLKIFRNNIATLDYHLFT